MRAAARRWAPRVEGPALETWRLSRDARGALVLGGVALDGLLERWGSPLHVVDSARVAENAARFQACPRGAARGCEVFYSYKTNPVPGVLRMLHGHGLGAEVVSPYELWLALRLGVNPARVVYNGPAKSPESLRVAVAVGVGLVNVNDRSELAPLAGVARDAGRRPRIGIRVVAPGRWGGQFGEPIDGGAALRAFEEARRHPSLRVVGLHAHYGGELSRRAELDAFLDGVLRFTDELRARLGLELEVLDLGGNLACPTVSRPAPWRRRLARSLDADEPPRPRGAVLAIEDYVARVRERVDSHFAAAGRPPPRVFLEPGRAVTGDAQHLLARVVQLRDGEPGAWAVLDAGIHVAEALRSELHQLAPVVASSRPRRRYRLSGPSCMVGDLLCAGWETPELAVGDGVAILDAGAYFVPFSTQFSFPRPAVVAVAGGGERLLRAAETFEDLVARDGAVLAGR